MILDALSCLIDVVDDCLGSLVGGFVDKDLVVFQLGDGDGLGVSLVIIRVKFEALFIAERPVGVVDVVAVSDFSLQGFPVRNASYEVIPSVSNIRVFELSVEDKVVVGVRRSQSDVVDG